MKTIFRTATLAALIITASCGKDDSPSAPNETDQITEQQEQTPLGIDLVADNVIITGGTKNMGTPPIPNEAISLDITDASKTAFLNEGFDIPFSSDGDVVGAYLQFKGNDGTVADSYYDINVSTNSTGKTVSNRSKYKKRFLSHSAKVNEATLDVDFNTQIEPGTFCYIVCVYDAEGNISAPQEVCITVESWGGNAAAVGNWNMVKEEKTKEDGSVATYLLGEESCDNVEELACNSGDVIESSRNCLTINEENLVINPDGTYIYKYDENYKYLNSSLSKENCEIIFEDDSYILNSYGKWAYVTEDENLVFIELSYEILADDGSGELESVTHEIGNGESLFDSYLEFSGNSFIATQGNYKIFFEK